MWWSGVCMKWKQASWCVETWREDFQNEFYLVESPLWRPGSNCPPYWRKTPLGGQGEPKLPCPPAPTKSGWVVSERASRPWSHWGFPDGTSGKEPTCQCRRHKRLRFDPWIRKIPWRRACPSTPVFLPRESHGQRSLGGYSQTWVKQLNMNDHTWSFWKEK